MVGLIVFAANTSTNVSQSSLSDGVVYQQNQVVISDTILLEKIIKCESNWNYLAKNPYSSAYGLCQFIDSTWQYVQNKWDMVLDRFSYQDQLYACQRLLSEEGTTHWLASKKCWK